MNCNWVPVGEPDERGRRKWRCSRKGCGKATGYTPHLPDKIFSECRVLGWGDMLAALLGIVHLTPQNVNRLRALLGLKKPCGCGKRKEKLNAAGERLQAVLQRGRGGVN